jgi:hypothetical protein
VRGRRGLVEELLERPDVGGAEAGLLRAGLDADAEADRARSAVPSGDESSTIIAVMRKSGFSAAMAARRGSSSPTLRASS